MVIADETIYSRLSAKFYIFFHREWLGMMTGVLAPMRIFIREESNPKYDQALLTMAENKMIDASCVNSTEELLNKMKKESIL